MILHGGEKKRTEGGSSRRQEEVRKVQQYEVLFSDGGRGGDEPGRSECKTRLSGVGGSREAGEVTIPGWGLATPVHLQYETARAGSAKGQSGSEGAKG